MKFDIILETLLILTQMLACDTVRVSDIEILCSFTTTLYH